MGNKHSGQNEDGKLGGEVPRPPSDLERNPGINSSKGVFGRGTNPEEIEGENTFEGDVMNDVDKTGAVSPGRRGRTSS
ncbi:MAG TPA: hypothetical protein VE033_02930 [Acetobacteraceae bacterium]|jgi:hypothetical protein|nr:hypothetical protein [Acetobacteraceae bacterium]